MRLYRFGSGGSAYLSYHPFGAKYRNMLLIPMGILLVGIFPLPIEFYILVRIVVFSSMGYLALQYIRPGGGLGAFRADAPYKSRVGRKQEDLLVSFFLVFFAAIYNPFIPVYLQSKALWIMFNIASIVLLNYEYRRRSTPDGLWETFYADDEGLEPLAPRKHWKVGPISMRAHWKNQKLHGLREAFHENGQLIDRVNFRDGLEDGLYEYFHSNGQLRNRGNYKEGVIDGFWENFHENGQLSSTENWIDGEREGLFETFDEDGNLTKTETYKDGVLVK